MVGFFGQEQLEFSVHEYGGWNYLFVKKNDGLDCRITPGGSMTNHIYRIMSNRYL